MKRIIKWIIKNPIGAAKNACDTKKLDKESIKIFEAFLEEIEMEITYNFESGIDDLEVSDSKAQKSKLEELEEARFRAEEFIKTCKERRAKTFLISRKKISEELRKRAKAVYDIAKNIEEQEFDDKIFHLALSDVVEA
ncbi:MAG: hypothetical protein K5769_04930 [Pseudobutyrivibrio sp.]|nr:hypothetical protein [Pseudobutyrivibrio sp.]